MLTVHMELLLNITSEQNNVPLVQVAGGAPYIFWRFVHKLQWKSGPGMPNSGMGSDCPL